MPWKESTATIKARLQREKLKERWFSGPKQFGTYVRHLFNGHICLQKHDRNTYRELPLTVN